MSSILIFDSSAVTCHTVSKQLRTYGFDTTQARSIGAARVALATKPVDLVILDLAAIASPGAPASAAASAAPDAGASAQRTPMTLLRELQRDRRWQNLPVIILTSSAHNSDRIEAQAAGAVAFLTKPVSTRELLFAVTSALSLQAPATHAFPQQLFGARQGAGQVEQGARSPAPRFPRQRDWRPDWAVPVSRSV